MLIHQARPVNKVNYMYVQQNDSLSAFRALPPIHQYLHANLKKGREAQNAKKQTQADHYNDTVKQL